TITVLRTPRGEALFDDMVARGLLEVRSMEEFENSMKVMIRLTKKQRERVPVPPGRTPRYVRPAGYPRVPADPQPTWRGIRRGLVSVRVRPAVVVARRGGRRLRADDRSLAEGELRGETTDDRRIAPVDVGQEADASVGVDRRRPVEDEDRQRLLEDDRA